MKTATMMARRTLKDRKVPSKATRHPMKPKHPLSAYNLFFQVERKRILNGTDHLKLVVTPSEVRAVSQESNKKPAKRLHRRTHGKIGFRELNNHVSQRWKEVDAQTRTVLEDEAIRLKADYVKKREEWKNAELVEATEKARMVMLDNKKSSGCSRSSKAEIGMYQKHMEEAKMKQDDEDFCLSDTFEVSLDDDESVRSQEHLKSWIPHDAAEGEEESPRVLVTPEDEVDVQFCPRSTPEIKEDEMIDADNTLKHLAVFQQEGEEEEFTFLDMMTVRDILHSHNADHAMMNNLLIPMDPQAMDLLFEEED